MNTRRHLPSPRERSHSVPRAPLVFPSAKLRRMKSALTVAFVLTACVSFAQGPGGNAAQEPARGNAAQGPGRGNAGQGPGRGAGQADLVRTTLPLEGAPKAIPGPYKVMKEPAFGSAGHVVFRPEDLGAFPRKDKLPVMAW